MSQDHDPKGSGKVWFIGIGSEKSGPFTEGEIRERIARNELYETDLLWKQGLPNWQEAQKTVPFRGLFRGESGVAAAPPPVSQSQSRASVDLPVSGTVAPGRQSSWFVDFIMFRIQIAPTILIILYLLMSAAMVVFGLSELFSGIRGLSAGGEDGMGGMGRTIAMGKILGAVVGMPLGLLFLRVFYESMIVLFQINQSLLDIRRRFLGR